MSIEVLYCFLFKGRNYLRWSTIANLTNKIIVQHRSVFTYQLIIDLFLINNAFLQYKKGIVTIYSVRMCYV